MCSNVKHNHVLHERVVIVAVEPVPVPVVRPEELTDVDDLGYADDGITNVAISVGYMQQADVPNVLAAIPDEAFESPIDFKNASYFLSTIHIEMGNRHPRSGVRGCRAGVAGFRRHHSPHGRRRRILQPPARPYSDHQVSHSTLSPGVGRRLARIATILIFGWTVQDYSRGGALLDRIDDIVTRCTMINPADSSSRNPALKPTARRRWR